MTKEKVTLPLGWQRFWATGFFSGLVPVASGTVGTVPAVFFYVLTGLVMYTLGWSQWIGWVMAGLVVVALPLAVYVSAWAEDESSVEDPGVVVIDEWLGYWATVAFLPFGWETVVLGFVLFRFMDIVKPEPAYLLQRLGKGWGVVLDDVMAGVYANLVLFWLSALIF
jgi:phosphatidylglycerophosphatase A